MLETFGVEKWDVDAHDMVLRCVKQCPCSFNRIFHSRADQCSLNSFPQLVRQWEQKAIPATAVRAQFGSGFGSDSSTIAQGLGLCNVLVIFVLRCFTDVLLMFD